MLKILILLFYISTRPDDLYDLRFGKLLIYTDIKIENLSIRYRKNEKSLEKDIDLKDVTKNYGQEDFMFESYVYFLKLPEENNGEIICEVQDDDEKRILHIKSIFKREQQEYTNTYFATHWTKERGDKDDDSFVYEANYTYIINALINDNICVIATNLERKIQLDKSLEFYIIKKISDINEKTIIFFSAAYDDLLFLRNNADFLNQHRELLNNYLYGLIYQVTHLYSLMNSFEVLYNSSGYESYIIKDKNSSELRNNIYNAFSDFYKGRFFIYTTELSDIEDKLKKSPQYDPKEDFFLFRNDLERLNYAFPHVLKFFNQKDEVEEEYVGKRNHKYYDVQRERSIDNIDPLILNLRDNLEIWTDLLSFRNFIKVSKFAEQYVKSVLNYENGGKSKELIFKELVKVNTEVKESSQTLSHLYGLFSKQPEIYLNNLLEDKIFKELTSISIDDLLEEYILQIERWQKCVGVKDICFNQHSKSKYFDILDLQKLWKCSNYKNEIVTLLATRKVELNQDNETGKNITPNNSSTNLKDTEEGKSYPKSLISIICLLIFVILVIVIYMLKNIKN